MKKFSLVLVMALALGGALAACGDDDDTADTAGAMSSVCDNQETVLASAVALDTLDPTETTGSDLSSMVDDLNESVENLQNAKADLVEQDVDNVQSAYDALVESLKDLDDVPLADLEAASAETIGAAIVAFQTAYTEAYANSSCTADDEADE